MPAPLPLPTVQFTRFVPFDSARPVPTDADRAEAERTYDEALAAGRFGMNHRREDYVAKLAQIVAQDRRIAEHRARFAPVERKAVRA